jgi:hypothetical protein
MLGFERIQNAVSYQNTDDGNFQMRFKVILELDP